MVISVAGSHHVPYRLQEELGVLHRLVVHVADRQGDDLGLELADCLADRRHGLRGVQQIEEAVASAHNTS